MRKVLVLIATTHIGEVKVEVTDIGGFVHADPLDTVLVRKDGQETWVFKKELENLRLEEE